MTRGSHMPTEPTADTLPVADVSPRELGEEVRKHRVRRGLRQGDLAERAGLSTSFISQFERGLTDSSISSLARICAALGIPVGALFRAAPAGERVLRREDAPTEVTGGCTRTEYSRAALDLDLHVIRLEPGAASAETPETHDRQHEILVCRAGFVAAELDGVQHILRTGDSIDFPSERPHRLVNIGHVAAELVWVVADAPSASRTRTSPRHDIRPEGDPS
ncbi:XRE family transcriptional regulator [Brevibacterium samyangense]|uniref:Cupin domain-containing protein n=1 Tax=Brevibacterium samyangense TaxID=366888 RepID=A0ABN2T9S9_9MICO